MNLWKKHFTNPNNKHLGRMGIPQNWYAGDKQDHTLRGGFVSISYFILHYGLAIYNIKISNLQAMLVSLVLVFGISLISEFIQKGKKDRVFSMADVVADVFGWVIIVLIGGNLFGKILFA
jgi:hypothetical protein